MHHLDSGMANQKLAFPSFLLLRHLFKQRNKQTNRDKQTVIKELYKYYDVPSPIVYTNTNEKIRKSYQRWRYLIKGLCRTRICLNNGK